MKTFLEGETVFVLGIFSGVVQKTGVGDDSVAVKLLESTRPQDEGKIFHYAPHLLDRRRRKEVGSKGETI